MKKVLYTIIIIITISIVSLFIYINKETILYFNNRTITKIDNNKQKKQIVLTKNEIKDKMDILKQRTKIKDLISRWDNYFINDQLNLALLKYNEALLRNPKDELLIEKIANTFFEMKRFDDAVSYYKKLILKEQYEKRYILSLFYSKDLTKKEERDLLKDTIKLDIKDSEKVFFYTTSIDCIDDFHLCKKTFEEKIQNEDVKSNELKWMKTIMSTYLSFWLTDIYYKNALVIWWFLKEKLYPITIILSQNILKEKPDYRTIIQILAQSYFDLWDYKNANFYLKSYFSIDQNDANWAYLLWIINLKLWEYILSNIYLNKAVDLNYNEKINVKRKLVYNYYLLENYEKMYNTFDEMLNNEKKIEVDDITPIINFALEKWEKEKVYNWVRKSIELFPKNPTFYGYMAKLERERWFLDKAIVYTSSWLLLDNENQFLNQELALIKISSWDLELAKDILNKVVKIDKNSEYWKKSQEEIDKINTWIYVKN